nr:MAG TPA: hypothetical protein [Caudoviricetes sp.]
MSVKKGMYKFIYHEIIRPYFLRFSLSERK